MQCSQVVHLARVGVRVLVVDVVCVMLVLIARVVVHAVNTQFSYPIFCSWRCTLYKDPGPAATGQSIKMFVIMHPSRCFPSFVVVVMIAATIFDQHVLTIHGSCVAAMVS